MPYCWTLFIPSKNCKEWGFRTNMGWLNHMDYLKKKKRKEYYLIKNKTN